MLYLSCKNEIVVSLKSLSGKAFEGLRHQVENTVEGGDIEFRNDDSNDAEDLVCENEADQHQMNTRANHCQNSFPSQKNSLHYWIYTYVSNDKAFGT